jgi:hypothetical protein
MRERAYQEQAAHTLKAAMTDLPSDMHQWTRPSRLIPGECTKGQYQDRLSARSIFDV